MKFPSHGGNKFYFVRRFESIGEAEKKKEMEEGEKGREREREEKSFHSPRQKFSLDNSFEPPPPFIFPETFSRFLLGCNIIFLAV